MMDNRVFNVNGKGEDYLLKVLEIAFEQEGSKLTEGYVITEEHGLILLWHINPDDELSIKFPTPLSAKRVAPIISTWLDSNTSDLVKLKGWDKDADHDGHNGKGWRVYVGDWGHVGSYHYSICAITPAFMWYGK